MYPWRFWACGYYGGRGPVKVRGMIGNYPLPGQAGKFAAETLHKDEITRDAELDALKAREDIGHWQWGTFDPTGLKLLQFDSRDH